MIDSTALSKHFWVVKMQNHKVKRQTSFKEIFAIFIKLFISFHIQSFCKSKTKQESQEANA